MEYQAHTLIIVMMKYQAHALIILPMEYRAHAFDYINDGIPSSCIEHYNFYSLHYVEDLNGLSLAYIIAYLDL